MGDNNPGGSGIPLSASEMGAALLCFAVGARKKVDKRQADLSSSTPSTAALTLAPSYVFGIFGRTNPLSFHSPTVNLFSLNDSDTLYEDNDDEVEEHVVGNYPVKGKEVTKVTSKTDSQGAVITERSNVVHETAVITA